jgi:hypothetical protein
MIVSLDVRMGTQVRAFAKAIPMPTTTKAIRKPGKSARLSSRSMLQGLRSETSPKKSNSQNKTLCLDKPTTWLAHRGFCETDFFGASPVASALDPRTGRDPDTQPPPYHPHSTTLAPEPEFVSQTRNFMLGRKDLPNQSSAGKTTLEK